MTNSARTLSRLAVSSLLLAGVLGLAACQSTAEKPLSPEELEMPFPPPPDEPRYIYERTLLSTADVRPRDDSERLRRMLTGEQVSGLGLGKPFDVAACAGRIYITDTVARSVRVFDVKERQHFEIGTDEPGSLARPLGLNTDDQCNLYVVDEGGENIKIYQPDGTFLRTVGDDQEFSRLSHVAVTPDGSRLFAVDTGGVDTDNHRVRVYDAVTGEYLRDIGARGRGPGQFNLPRDAEVGPDGLLYVVDGGNFRVQVFRQDGTFVSTFGDVGRRPGQFSRPKGIAIDRNGRIFVSDAAFGNFQIFNAEGQLLLFVGSRNARPGPAVYMLPAGIDTDEDGRVLMVDQFFRKVDVYRPAEISRADGQLGNWFDASQ